MDCAVLQQEASCLAVVVLSPSRPTSSRPSLLLTARLALISGTRSAARTPSVEHSMDCAVQQQEASCLAVVVLPPSRPTSCPQSLLSTARLALSAARTPSVEHSMDCAVLQQEASCLAVVVLSPSRPTSSRPSLLLTARLALISGTRSAARTPSVEDSMDCAVQQQEASCLAVVELGLSRRKQSLGTQHLQ